MALLTSTLGSDTSKVVLLLAAVSCLLYSLSLILSIGKRERRLPPGMLSRSQELLHLGKKSVD